MTNLKIARLEAGFTQKHIATLLNISQQTYSDYENGRTEPDFETLKNIADILKTSVDYLLGRSDDLGNVTVQSSAPPLPADELELLTLYRSMSNPQKRMLVAYGESLTEPLATNRKPQ